MKALDNIQDMPQTIKWYIAFSGGKLRYQVLTVSVLGQDEGYTVKYTPLPEGVPEGET